MRVFSNYLMGDPGLWGLMSLAHAMPLSGDVFAVIPDHQPIQSYEDYYTATSSYFEGQWHKPIFVHESDFVESEDDIEVPLELIYGTFDRKPIKILKKEKMICYSFATMPKSEMSHQSTRIVKEEYINTLLDYFDGRVINLGNTRHFDTPKQIVERFDVLQQSELYIGCHCSWSCMAHVFQVPPLYLISKPPQVGDKTYQEHQANRFKYFENKVWKYGWDSIPHVGG